MGNKRKENTVLRVVGGVAYVDVSTPKYPGAIATVSEAGLPLMLDGCGCWCAGKLKPSSDTLYVVRGIGGRKNRKMFTLHRLILGLTDPKIQGDHRDGNGLNNTRQNLRAATHSQNSWNSKRRSGGTSQYRGVSWDAERAKWIASISREDGKGRKHLGRFDNETDAAHAYDTAASSRYGEFARANFKSEECNG